MADHHDADTGRGNIDHVLVGPAGVLTVETKSHGGRISVDRIDERMLNQAYARASTLSASAASTSLRWWSSVARTSTRPVTRGRGVTVLPARMFAGHLHRCREQLSPDEIAAAYRRLTTALG